MSATLVDAVQSAFNADVISKASVLLGEPEANIKQGIHGAIPLILTDIVHKAWFPESTTRIWDLSRQATAGDFFGELHELSISTGGLVPGSILLNKGMDYARALLVDRLDPVVNEISRYAGISIPSASFITGIVSFASLDAVGRHINMYNVDANGLSLWLKTQTDSLKLATPAGLQVRHALDIRRYPWETTPTRRSRNTALYMVLLLIIVICAAFFIYQNHHNNANILSTDTTAPATVSPTPQDTIPAR